MRSARCLFTSVVALTCSLAGLDAIQADQVRLQDGTTLVGVISDVTNGTVTIHTPHFGELTLKMDAVASLETDGPRTITLTSGENYTGLVSSTEERMTIVTGAAAGREVIPGEIQSLSMPAGAPLPETEPAQTVVARPEYKPAPEVVAAQQAEEEAAADATAEFARPVWTGRLELRFDGESGNNDSFDFAGGIELNRETIDTRLKLYARGKYGEEESVRTDNEIIGGARYEKDINERWYWYARTELEYDEFENLDLRAIGVIGLGYYAIKEDDHEWKLRGGLGYEHERYDSGRTEDNVIVDLGWDYYVDLDSDWRFTHSITWTPAIDDPFEDYRIVSDTGIEIPLTDDKSWKIRGGLLNEYDNTPDPGFERLDNTWYLSFIRDW